MRIVFAGTPQAAVPALRALAASEHDIALVITRPDAPLGRKRVLTPSPVASAAEELGLPVLKTARLDADATQQIAATEAELGVIVAYGGLVREPLLSAPPFGWINLHFSLLPAWRGAAPVQRALIAGDELGWTVFDLVPELDAGDVYAAESYEADSSATAGDVLAALATIGGDALVGIVTSIGAGARPVPQSGDPSFAPKLSIADANIDVSLGADVVLARYRGVTPEPGARVFIDGAPLKLLEIASTDVVGVPAGTILLQDKRVVLGTADVALELVRIQPAGKQAMAAGDWWRGQRVEAITIDDVEVTA